MATAMAHLKISHYLKCSTRNFSTTSQIFGSRYYNPKISVTVNKNVRVNMERIAYSEVMRERKESMRKGPRSTPKNPILYDTRKTKVFNRQFMENIGQVMSSIPELIGHGISITKVRNLGV